MAAKPRIKPATWVKKQPVFIQKSIQVNSYLLFVAVTKF